MRVRLIGVTLAVALLAGACSGGGEDDERAAAGTTTTPAAATSSTRAPSTTGSTTTTEPATTTTVAAEADPADVTLAGQSLVTAADLGDGWKAEPAADGAAAEGLRAACPELARELDSIAADQDPPPARASAGSALGTEGLPAFQDRVVVARDDALAARTYGVFGTNRYATCTAEAFLAEMQASGAASAQAPQISTLPVAPAGDAIEATRATVVVTLQGAEVTIFLDHVVLRRGRVVHSLLLGSADLFPVPDGTLTAAVDATAG